LLLTSSILVSSSCNQRWDNSSVVLLDSLCPRQERSGCCLHVKSPWGPSFFSAAVAKMQNQNSLEMFCVWHVNHFPLTPSVLAWTRKWLSCQHVNISRTKNFVNPCSKEICLNVRQHKIELQICKNINSIQLWRFWMIPKVCQASCTWKIKSFLILDVWIWSRFCCQFLANATLKLPCLSTNATRYFRS
jgi:hypothetical protein